MAITKSEAIDALQVGDAFAFADLSAPVDGEGGADMTPGNAEVSLDEIYQLLLDLREDVTAMKAASIRQTVDDHETRIRTLERKVWPGRKRRRHHPPRDHRWDTSDHLLDTRRA